MTKAQHSGSPARHQTEQPLFPGEVATPLTTDHCRAPQRSWYSSGGPERILSLLRQDHNRTRSILQMLANQLDVFCLAGRPEYLFMLEALRHAGNYPNRFHYPNEARLFAALAARSVEARDQTQVVLEEHVRLTALCSALRQQVEQLLTEVLASKSRVATRAWEYIALQRQHMSFEEKVIFPMLERTFEPSDWTYFERILPFPGDPLGGPLREP